MGDAALTSALLPNPHLMASRPSGPQMKRGLDRVRKGREGHGGARGRRCMTLLPPPPFWAQGDQELWSPHWVGPWCHPALEGHPPSLSSSLSSAPSGTGPGPGHSASWAPLSMGAVTSSALPAPSAVQNFPVSGEDARQLPRGSERRQECPSAASQPGWHPTVGRSPGGSPGPSCFSAGIAALGSGSATNGQGASRCKS